MGVADGTAATGTTVNNGATLEIAGGSNVGNEAITLGSGGNGTGTLRSTSGSNATGGGITLNANGLIDTLAGSSLTIGGGVDMNGANGGRLNVSGAGETTIQGAITGTQATSSLGPTTPGLLGGTLSGNGPEPDPNPGDLGVSLGVTAGQTNGAPWAGNNQTIVYTGQFFDADGIFSFAENIDDKVRLSIDGTEVISSDQWNVPTSSGSTSGNGAAGAGTLDFGMGPDGDGWHDFELRMSNGGGGKGANNCCTGWSTTFGFGLNDAGSTSTDGNNYIIPLDNGTGNLFRLAAPVVVNANDLHFFGDGILRLNGDSTYVGTTSVGDTNGAFGTPDATTGILIVNGTTSGQGSYYISSGATIGGNGTINLAGGESVNIAGSPGTISPGDAGPGYTPVAGGDATFSFGQDAATVGVITMNGASSSDTAVDLDGILQLDVVDPITADMLVALQGIIDIDPTSAILTINGESDFSQVDLGALGFQGGDELLLISATDGIVGEFLNDAKDGDVFTDAGGLAFSFAQDDTSLRLVAGVPEPATFAIWTLLGLAGFGYACRQRLRRR